MKICKNSGPELLNICILSMGKLNLTMMVVFKTKFVSCSWNVPGEHDFLSYLTESILYVCNHEAKSELFGGLMDIMKLKPEYSIYIFTGLARFLELYATNTLKNDNGGNRVLNKEVYVLIFKSTIDIIFNSIVSWKSKENVSLLGKVIIIMPRHSKLIILYDLVE
jgi:hypothetical protein